jgi:hypothetical protein
MNLISVADGRDNIVGSLILAGNYAIPEVCVYFSHKLIRGNRTIKVTENHPAMRTFCERGHCYIANDRELKRTIGHLFVSVLPNYLKFWLYLCTLKL